NDRFRDSVRRFWRGDGGMLGAFTTRFAGSADVFRGRPLSRGINFITAHDGFTLADLISYETKHNQANGEDNHDGSDGNLSWNNGAEGPSSDTGVQATRECDVRALLATLLLSRGTPMLSMGDELGRTQRGNNNAYAMDNAGSWVDWAAADEVLIDDTAALIALRRSFAPLFNGDALRGQPADGEVVADVTWHARDGQLMTEAEWNRDSNRTLIAVLFADDVRAALVFHADRVAADIVLPAPRLGHGWTCVLGGEGSIVQARSVAVFREKAVVLAEPDVSSPTSLPVSWPGLARPPTTWGTADGKDVGGRAKPGHDTGAQTGARAEAWTGAQAETWTGRQRGVTDGEIDHLAGLAGIDPIWWDVDGGHHTVPVDTKRALLAAMRLPATTRGGLNDSLARLTLQPSIPPTLTARYGQAIPIALGRPRPAWITLLREDGSLERFQTGGGDLLLPPQPIGRHRLLDEDRPEHTCHLTVAPDTCYLPPALLADNRRFGIAAHLYTLRSPGDQGIGDFSTLRRFATEAARAGAASIGLNPLHALFPHDRDRVSPYQPSDRRFLDPIYIDVSGFPNGAGLSSSPGPVDYRSVWDAKRAVLLAAFKPGGGEAIPAALRRFATFEAIAETLRTSDWAKWPGELRHPDDPGVTAFAAQHQDTIEFHAFLQRLADQQLAEAAASAKRDGLELGFYRDLAVGAAPDGAEAWSAQDTLMHGVSVGAPPDPIATQGQIWCLPPPDPLAMRRDGYRAFQELLVANMRHAGALRIDHVMGLCRLFVIPDGASGANGAYVTYPMTDLLAQVALESHRARCLVVGEDLGTVPEGMPETLAANNILSYSVLWFQRRDGRLRPPPEWRRLAAACV
ncbi:MAG TPA: 4-alpha-glucanotransferase, partial [Rhodopila sp.]